MKLIVEMEYPKNGCSECRLKYKRRGYGGVFYCFNHLCVDKWTYGRTQNGDRPSWCPIVGVLPEEHGDLIDRDALRKYGMMYRGGIDEGGLIYVPLRDVMKSISNAPTVIAAEREDNGTTC